MSLNSIRQLLLGGAATLVLATGSAAADDLSALKARIDALQYKVNALEARPAAAPGIANAGLISFRSGSGIGPVGAERGGAAFVRGINAVPADRGWTMAITPTADLAPAHEISISGYIKADFIYDADQDLGDSAAFTALSNAAQTDENVRLHARQSRLRIRSRSATAVGEIRTLVEGDFFGNGTLGNNTLRLRHAWGEWDMTPNWTFGAGQTWSNFMTLIDLPDTIDFTGPAGVAFTRQGQVRLTYRNGGFAAALAVEDPRTSATHTGAIAAAGTAEGDVGEEIPDFTGRVQFDTPGGFTVALSGVVGEHHIDPDASTAATVTGHDSELMWGGIAAVSVNASDRLKLTASGGTGRGAGRYIVGTDTAVNLGGTAADPSLDGREYWHASASAHFALSDELASNIAWGYVDFDGGDTIPGQEKYLQTAHVNLIWQPVTRLKMGIEGIWAERKIDSGGTPDAFRAQFGTWFFF